MGATNLVGSILNFYNKSKNPTFKSSVHTSYIVRTRFCYIAKKKRQKIEVASLDALLEKLKLCNFWMTQNCSTHTNTRLNICLYGLFVCPRYSSTTYHTSYIYAMWNPSTCQRCYRMENLPR